MTEKDILTQSGGPHSDLPSIESNAFTNHPSTTLWGAA